MNLNTPIPTIYISLDLDKTKAIDHNPFVAASVVFNMIIDEYKDYEIFTKIHANNGEHIVDIHNAFLLFEKYSYVDNEIIYTNLKNKIIARINNIIETHHENLNSDLDTADLFSKSTSRFEELSYAKMKVSELNKMNFKHLNFHINHGTKLEIYSRNENGIPIISLNPYATMYALRKTAKILDRLIETAQIQGEALQADTKLATIDSNGEMVMPFLGIDDFKSQATINEMIQSIAIDITEADPVSVSDDIEGWLWDNYISNIHKGIKAQLFKHYFDILPLDR